MRVALHAVVALIIRGATPAQAQAQVWDVDDACTSSSDEGSTACGVDLLQRRARKFATGGEAGHAAVHEEQQRKAGAVQSPLTVALVHEVYTFGAPATSKVPFRNAATPDGCFPGLRSYTEDLLGARDEIHQTDAASVFNFLSHSLTSSVCLRWARDSIYTPCDSKLGLDGHPDWPLNGAQIYQEWRLHKERHYRDRLGRVTIEGRSAVTEEPFATARKFMFLAYVIYDNFQSAKARVAREMPSWKIVGLALDKHGDDEDPIYIVQENSTLDCAVVFSGTNSFGELFNSLQTYGTGYCGYTSVHAGYRNELWFLTGRSWMALKPKLAQCNRVICVGHSLGGALCEIFAACANSGHFDDPDYQRLAWTKNTTAAMPEVDG